MAWNEQQRAALSQKRGRAAATIADPARRQAFIAGQENAEQKGPASDEAYTRLDNEAENALALPEQTPPPPQQQPQAPSYRRGTPFVKHTGLAKLHRGEAVVPRKKAAAMRRNRSFFGG